MKLLPEISNENKGLPHPTAMPFGPTGRGIPPVWAVEDSDGGLELWVELAPGALGALGHDRLRWDARLRPSSAIRVDAARDAARRRRCQDLARVVSIEGELCAVQFGGGESLVVAVWLSGLLVRVARRRGWDVDRLWRLVVGHLVRVVGEGEVTHPGWASLVALDWSRVTPWPAARAA